MGAAEFRQGLQRLSILHEQTLPYSPYQNAKQERFWGGVEGRLLAMLEGCSDLRLEQLNEASQAWVELEYNRRLHAELGTSPLRRYIEGPEVGRPSPSSEELRRAFRQEVSRIQRDSDGTISLEGKRFEIPSRYRPLQRVYVRYASWDLSQAQLVDARSGKALCVLYPLDKQRNADGMRRTREPIEGGAPLEASPSPSSGETAPLLRKLLADYAATGLPPAYLPKEEKEVRR